MLSLAARRVGLLTLLILLVAIPPARGEGNQEIWPIQDGSLTLTQSTEGPVLSFPYIPFLAQSPAWTPAYPREYQQPEERVIPLPGLGGKLTFHVSGGAGADNLQILSRTPWSAESTLRNGSAEIRLSWFCPLGQPCVIFECANPQQKDATLEISLNGFGGKTLWATPQKKMKHDWGVSNWEWKPGERCLLQSCGNPVDATHSPVTALWVGESTPEWKGSLPTCLVVDPLHYQLRIPLHPGQPVRLGFEHADNQENLKAQLTARRSVPLSLAKLGGEWNNWLTDAHACIKKKTGADPAQLPPDRLRILDNNLLTTRQLFLSNGVVLTEAMTPGTYPLSLPEQGVALNHWREMGLEYPFLSEQAELTRNNRLHQRSLDIPLFRAGGLMEILKQGKIILTAVDPDSPPDKASFDTLLGYVISGGHLTLVEGGGDFAGKDGWWKEAGAASPSDYAIRMMGVPVDPDSRQILDEEGIAVTTNTFTKATSSLAQGSSTAPQTVAVIPPRPGGYLLLFPSTSEDPAGLQILSGRIGGETFRPFTSGEDQVLAGGYAPRVLHDGYGETLGCHLLGEAFRAYRIPTSVTGPVEFTLCGGWTITWSETPPSNDKTLRKKAFQSWYKRELMTVPVLKTCHPVVYSGTYTCRVFDVTDSEQSPFLFAKVGRGTFIWLGLPRDYLLQGSDTGSDLQNSLRNDPTYDLIRLTFAFHDPKHAGSERVSRTPFSCWGEGWSQSLASSPEVLNTFFAWKPVESAGLATREMNSWIEETFSKTLDVAQSEGWTLPLHHLVTREVGAGRQVLDFADNAFVHAVYRGLERTSKVTGRIWLQEDSRRKAEGLAKDLPALLEGFGEGAVYARTIADSTARTAIPLSVLLPRTAWAVTEIRTADFPGEATAQTRLLSSLANDPAVSGDTRAMAVIATRDKDHRAQFLGLLLEGHTDPVLGLIGREGKRFDLATAVPTLQAMILATRP